MYCDQSCANNMDWYFVRHSYADATAAAVALSTSSKAIEEVKKRPGCYCLADVCLSRAISPRRSEFESQRAVFISFPGPASLSSALVAVEASPFLSQTMLLVVVRRLPGLLSLSCIILTDRSFVAQLRPVFVSI